MDAKTMLEQLVLCLRRFEFEGRRRVFTDIQRKRFRLATLTSDGYPNYDISTLSEGYVTWNNIYSTVRSYLYNRDCTAVLNDEISSKLIRFCTTNFPDVEFGKNEGYNYSNSNFIVYERCFSKQLSTLKIPVSSAKEYLEYIISLEQQYNVKHSNIQKMNDDINKIQNKLIEKEERIAKEQEKLRKDKDEIVIEPTPTTKMIIKKKVKPTIIREQIEV